LYTFNSEFGSVKSTNILRIDLSLDYVRLADIAIS